MERCFHKKKWTNNPKRGAQIIKYSQSPRTPIQGTAQRNIVSIKKNTQPRSIKTPKRTKERYLL
ncbi:hypothetical protein A7N88_00400 [Listeria monocytogenes]|nr:hypothetical protein AJM35_11965 [Listeria monocytogenes]OET10692.1 hypothetical protein AJL08_08170 [Listeria monocytogenes]PCW76963.1 hypothetical protein A7N88_00400 [Listeria monocytogenes]PCX93024.1 hypothetical protein A7N90_13045 [Listeria monocytogenes]